MCIALAIYGCVVNCRRVDAIVLRRPMGSSFKVGLILPIIRAVG